MSVLTFNQSYLGSITSVICMGVNMEKEFFDYLNQLANQKLFEMDEYFYYHREKYIPEFQHNFKETCQTIENLQKNGQLNHIAYLEYTMLYTNVTQKKYIAEVRVYDDMWYLDKQQKVVGLMDISPYFIKMEELKEELLKERKRYKNRISKSEILEQLVPYFKSFYKYFTSTCRFGILDCIELPEFERINRIDKFEINVGEYMADTEPVYKENQEKDSEDMLIWFKDREEFDYAFEDFVELDFSDEDLSEIDLRYADLRKTNLKHTNLQDALLISTRFCGANLEQADLKYCSLYEADFTGANLEQADFAYAEGDSEIVYDEIWDSVCYRGVSFVNANLRHANFLHGSFLGANFEGADMTESIWSEQQVEKLNLTNEQKNSIIIR